MLELHLWNILYENCIYRTCLWNGCIYLKTFTNVFCAMFYTDNNFVKSWCWNMFSLVVLFYELMGTVLAKTLFHSSNEVAHWLRQVQVVSAECLPLPWGTEVTLLQACRHNLSPWQASSQQKLKSVLPSFTRLNLPRLLKTEVKRGHGHYKPWPWYINSCAYNMPNISQKF